MSEQLFHVGIKAIVQNEHGDVLLVGRRSRSQNAPHLDLPGGRMEPNESFLQTLDRELREEIGVSYAGEPKQVAATVSRIDIPDPLGTRALVLVVYFVRLTSTTIVLGDGEEVSAWLPPKKAAEALSSKYDENFCAVIAALGAAG